MGIAVLGQKRSGVELEVREEERLRVPNWFGEAVLLGQYWIESGLVGYLEEEVRIVRGRMGRYEVVDFVLLLNAYAISGEKTLANFFQSLAPVKEVLMSVWGRSRCPSASSLSRFLAAVTPEAVGRLRELFEADLGRNGVQVMQGVGIFDRVEDHDMVFDVDGTVSAARQLELSLGNRPVPQPILPPSLQFMQERTGEAKQDSSAQTGAGQATHLAKLFL
ncbi:hypothetical protein [Leptolyngbya sp. FACHB-711]|uniref:hypothetical protein n=1 Tax=Leptolyngbya sp. FACHB-711 TaxID=2692813 RepID=UPI0016890DCB|nr:hypothetical protein [Leptolyngbya sp. FACHB-711]MBD2023771.1 hypothetical protein [Leptolyngbya sp. FACHB-711]